jgi:hypothetical protein
MTDTENTFIISENSVPGLFNRRIGDAFNADISYQIVEVTKSYCMIRVKYIAIKQQKRTF